MITKTELFNAPIQDLIDRIKHRGAYVIHENTRSSDCEQICFISMKPRGKQEGTLTYTRFKKMGTAKLKKLLPDDGCIMVHAWTGEVFYVRSV